MASNEHKTYYFGPDNQQRSNQAPEEWLGNDADGDVPQDDYFKTTYNKTSNRSMAYFMDDINYKLDQFTDVVGNQIGASISSFTNSVRRITTLLRDMRFESVSNQRAMQSMTNTSFMDRMKSYDRKVNLNSIYDQMTLKVREIDNALTNLSIRATYQQPNAPPPPPFCMATNPPNYFYQTTMPFCQSLQPTENDLPFLVPDSLLPPSHPQDNQPLMSFNQYSSTNEVINATMPFAHIIKPKAGGGWEMIKRDASTETKDLLIENHSENGLPEGESDEQLVSSEQLNATEENSCEVYKISCEENSVAEEVSIKPTVKSNHRCFEPKIIDQEPKKADLSSDPVSIRSSSLDFRTDVNNDQSELSHESPTEESISLSPFNAFQRQFDTKSISSSDTGNQVASSVDEDTVEEDIKPKCLASNKSPDIQSNSISQREKDFSMPSSDLKPLYEPAKSTDDYIDDILFKSQCSILYRFDGSVKAEWKECGRGIVTLGTDKDKIYRLIFKKEGDQQIIVNHAIDSSVKFVAREKRPNCFSWFATNQRGLIEKFCLRFEAHNDPSDFMKAIAMANAEVSNAKEACAKKHISSTD
ncbi:hypothetical protein ACOME3_008576 [Neoechinorhynchus agilis]